MIKLADSQREQGYGGIPPGFLLKFALQMVHSESS